MFVCENEICRGRGIKEEGERKSGRQEVWADTRDGRREEGREGEDVRGLRG